MDHMPMDGNEDNDQQEMDSTQILQWHAAKFLLHVRDKCKTSHRAMEKVMFGTQQLLEEYMSLVKYEIERLQDPDSESVPYHRIVNILNGQLSSSLLFNEVKTKYKLEKFMVEHLGMIMPEGIEVKRELVWKRKPRPDLVEVTRYGYWVPFLPSIRRLLLNDQVRFCVENPRQGGGLFKTILDGNYYKNHEFFSSNQNSLAVILYYDEIEIADPIGSKVHKLGMFYWTLANIYPEFRSTLNAINLLAVAKYSYIKNEGIDSILRKFVEDITILQTEGITFQVENNLKTFKGSLLMVVGDTPATALLGGFKRSVSASKPCRRCMTDQERWKLYFLESDFILRTKESHLQHIEAISEPNLTEEVRKFWKKHFGVNRKSVLMDIPGFNVTRSHVQDLMHVANEGILKIAIEVFLSFCIGRGFFHIDTLNSRINLFDYGHLSRDKPSEIKIEHINNGLRQNSAQTICLANVLPFLILYKLVGDDGAEDGEAHEKWNNFIKLLQIMNMCYAYQLAEDDVHFLKRLIQVWMSEFKELYPDAMVPKFHFLLDIISQIMDFGPPRQHTCMRFEAAHAWYKSLIKVTRNFKNVPWTFACRQEAMRCHQLARFPRSPSVRFLYPGHSIKEGPMKDLINLPLIIQEPLYQLLNGVDKEACQVMLTQEVSVNGVTFRVRGIILIDIVEEELPKFAIITDIIVHGGEIYLAFVPFLTCSYHHSLNAYRIDLTTTGDQGVMHVSTLIHPHPLSVYRYNRCKFIILFNHTRTEFIP